MNEKYEKSLKRLENIIEKINIIMSNRLFVAVFLIGDGISFLFNPNTTISGMAQNTILLVLLASISSLLANLTAKTKNKKSIIISLIIVIICIILFIYPDLISAYIQILFALFIMYEGIVNIANTLNLNRVLNHTQAIANKLNKFADSNETKKKMNIEIDSEIEEQFDSSIKEQKDRLMNPLKNVVNKTNKSSHLYIIANIISILMGVFLIVFPDMSIWVWGLIFIYTGISDLMVAARTMNLTSKFKEKKFKEILYDENKGD